VKPLNLGAKPDKLTEMRPRWISAFIGLVGMSTGACTPDVRVANCAFADDLPPSAIEHIEHADGPGARRIAELFAGEATRTTVDRIKNTRSGPFGLVAISCQRVPVSHVGGNQFLASPDLGSVAVFNSFDGKIAIAELSAPALEPGNPDGFQISGDELGVFGRRVARWSSDSRSIWATTQKIEMPRGIRSGPVRTVRVEGSMPRELPELSHPSGPLDAVLWADDGRALALFNQTTVAFVDAVNGRVLESLALRSLHPTADRTDILAAEVAVLPDGRMRAFLSVFNLTDRAAGAVVERSQSWVVWTQRDPPRLLPDPYPGSNGEIDTAISADGARLLAVRRFHRVDTTCPYSSPHPERDCEVGPPVDGALAALHDLETGRAVWVYDVRITLPGGNSYFPALSDDGRYALIGVPPTVRLSRSQVGLISTRDGSLQQTFPIDRAVAVGFARGSDRLWIHSENGVTAVYALR
jgi:hypothetical protein